MKIFVVGLFAGFIALTSGQAWASERLTGELSRSGNDFSIVDEVTGRNVHVRFVGPVGMRNCLRYIADQQPGSEISVFGEYDPRNANVFTASELGIRALQLCP